MNKIWASDLSNEDLMSEYRRIGQIIGKGFGEGSGSPGEWYYERYDELRSQIKFRISQGIAPSGQGR